MAQAASQRPTIRQIADQAGVSIATVSRVLNGRGDVADETRDIVSRVIRENGYTANRSARGLSAGRTGLRRRRRPARLSRVLLRHPRRRGRGALRARPPDRALADQAGARPRGLGARSPARHDRRLPDHPPRGVERGARAAPGQRFSVRRHRPADAARRADPVRLGREHVRRRPGDAPSARARTSAHRADRGPERLARDRRSPARISGSACVGRHPPRPHARGRIDPRDRPRARCRRLSAGAARPADGDLRVQRRHRDRRHPGRTGPRPARPRGPVGRRLRRRRARDDRDAGADDGPPAARRRWGEQRSVS